jgi:hypothetical protein
LQNPDYFNITAGFPGVCFGYQITENTAKNFDIQMFFNDQTLMGGPNSTGVPN